MIWVTGGFWDDPHDWDFLRPLFLEKLGLKLQYFDKSDLANDTQSFLKGIRRTDPQPLLLAYSMGARICLSHALLTKENPFRAAILLGPHLGLSQKEAALRVEGDELWAQKFISQDWEGLVKEWNANPIFNGHVLTRKEDPFTRRKLALELRELGAGRQNNLRPQLHQLKIPTLWVVGEKDTKYAAELHFAQSQNPNIQGLVMPGVGHRLHLEKPAQFTAQSLQFLSGYFSGRRFADG